MGTHLFILREVRSVMPPTAQRAKIFAVGGITDLTAPRKQRAAPKNKCVSIITHTGNFEKSKA